MNKKTIDLIRKRYQFPVDITDEDIAKHMKGTLAETVANIEISKVELSRAVGRVLSAAIKRIKEK